jgi:hypothetical protein
VWQGAALPIPELWWIIQRTGAKRLVVFSFIFWSVAFGNNLGLRCRAFMFMKEIKTKFARSKLNLPRLEA